MTRLVEEKRAEIVEACARNRVARLDVFGSALRDDFRPGESDVDFLVDFQPVESGGFSHPYFALLRELEEIMGMPVDLVMVDAVKNPYVAREIARTKQGLYGA